MTAIPRAPASSDAGGRRLWRAVLADFELAEHPLHRLDTGPGAYREAGGRVPQRVMTERPCGSCGAGVVSCECASGCPVGSAASSARMTHP
jgi:hypothetical protein